MQLIRGRQAGHDGAPESDSNVTNSADVARARPEPAHLPGRHVLAAGLLLLTSLLLASLEWFHAVIMPSWVWLSLITLAALALAANSNRVKATETASSVPQLPLQPDASLAQSEVTWPAIERRRAQLIFTAASHELRTPINAIVGFSELLRDAERNNTGRKQREGYAGTILDNAKHLQQCLNDVLDANRIETGALHISDQPCDMAEIIEVVSRERHAAAGERGVSIIARVADGISCSGDGNRLRQALACIVDNAIKFSPEDGIVNVNMLRGTKGQLVVTVTDAGPGLSPGERAQLFNPFQQLDEGAARHHAGLGLGLFIARGIFRLHGGDVTFASSAKSGTEVRLTLPAGRVNWHAAGDVSREHHAASKRVA